jgi:hypothetical protein
LETIKFSAIRQKLKDRENFSSGLFFGMIFAELLNPNSILSADLSRSFKN